MFVFHASTVTDFIFNPHSLFKMCQNLQNERFKHIDALSVICQWQICNTSIFPPCRGFSLSLQWTERRRVRSHDQTPTAGGECRLISRSATARGGRYSPRLCPHFQTWQPLKNSTPRERWIIRSTASLSGLPDRVSRFCWRVLSDTSKPAVQHELSTSSTASTFNIQWFKLKPNTWISCTKAKWCLFAWQHPTLSWLESFVHPDSSFLFTCF